MGLSGMEITVLSSQMGRLDGSRPGEIERWVLEGGCELKRMRGLYKGCWDWISSVARML